MGTGKDMSRGMGPVPREEASPISLASLKETPIEREKDKRDENNRNVMHARRGDFAVFICFCSLTFHMALPQTSDIHKT